MDDTTTFLLAPANLPFALSACAVAAIFIIEILGMLVGLSFLHSDIDLDVDLDGNGIPDYLEGGHGGVLDWINPGHVPLMAIMVASLTTFTVIGLSLQSFYATLTGGMAPMMLSIPVVLAVTLPVTRWCSRWLSRAVPAEVSAAISVDSLSGLPGVVNVGPVSRDVAGKARFTDRHGTDHNLFVFTSSDENIDVGENVVLLGPHREKTYAHLVRKI